MEETSKKVGYTESPWTCVEQHVGIGAIEIDGDNKSTIVALVYGRDSYEQAANARIIAAAPSLLEALEHLVNADPNAPNWNYVAARESAMKAIKLAKVEIKTELI